MILFKCEDCGLLTNEEFYICPKCNSEKNKLKTDTYNIEEEIYTLTMDDYDYVLENHYTKGVIEFINKTYSRETIIDILRRKMEIEYDEYIRAVVDCRLLENYYSLKK